ncbi:MAG TPA: DUF2442 domain-containing protein [Candidatus Limnocylindria bacterium]|nr:DUF2442 domain-containing protein [Candidatus Limnocylindria bacterium]
MRCDDEGIRVTLSDGRVIAAPLTDRLRRAAPSERRGCRVVDHGTALRWESLDEDLSVAALLGVAEDAVEKLAGFVRPR